MLSVTTNTASTIAQLALTKTRKGFGVALERLSTGRCSSASLDAASFALADEKKLKDFRLINVGVC